METYVVCHMWISEMCCTLLLIRFIFPCKGIAIVTLRCDIPVVLVKSQII